jgi:hypothetical protein
LSKPQKEPLRLLSQQEQHALQRMVKATAERMDVIKRARALLAVADGQRFRTAARDAGLASGDTVSQLVKRFNQQGLGALLIASGRGRKPTSTPDQRCQVVAAFRREPERKADGTATWSLSLLRRRRRAMSMPKGGAGTIGRTRQQAGYVYGPGRTWCQTGTVQRKRTRGIVEVHDPKTEENTSLSEWASQAAEQAGRPRWGQEEAGPYQTIPHPGQDWHQAGKPKQHPQE